MRTSPIPEKNLPAPTAPSLPPPGKVGSLFEAEDRASATCTPRRCRVSGCVSPAYSECRDPGVWEVWEFSAGCLKPVKRWSERGKAARRGSRTLREIAAYPGEVRGEPKGHEEAATRRAASHRWAGAPPAPGPLAHPRSPGSPSRQAVSEADQSGIPAPTPP